MTYVRFLGAVVAVFLLALPLSAQTQQTRSLRSIVLESFDDPDARTWVVTASKFSPEDLPESAYVRTWPDQLYREEPEGQELRALGVRAAFTRKGYNFVELTPSTEDENGELQPQGIPIPGTVDTIGVWVWGSRRDYYLDVQLRDFRGVVHTLRMGDVSFRGWQNLQIQVPTSVPQESNYVLQEEGLEIVKLVLWTRPQERVDEFYIYFDEIKVVTDMFRRRFDGEELADPERIEELWSGSSGN